MISAWQLEKRVSFPRLLERLIWLLELRNDPERMNSIKGLDEKPIDEAIDECAEAVLRKQEEGFDVKAEVELIDNTLLTHFFFNYGFDNMVDAPLPPSTDKDWKVCPTCGNPAYFRVTKLNYRCTKGHITQRKAMPGDDFFESG
jgi:hypothetical protein